LTLQGITKGAAARPPLFLALRLFPDAEPSAWTGVVKPVEVNPFVGGLLPTGARAKAAIAGSTEID
jgi:hypothetical protein